VTLVYASTSACPVITTVRTPPAPLPSSETTPPLPSSETTPPSPSIETPPPSPPPSPTIFKNTQSTGDIDCCNNIVDGETYGTLVLAPWMHADATRYEAAGIRTFLYKDMSSAREYTRGHAIQATGVRIEDMRPEWYLLDSNGQRCTWEGYNQPGNEHVQVDVGNAAYQQKWAETVIAEAKQYGYKGITIDNAQADFSTYCPGRVFPKYPTVAEQASATESFLAYVGPRLKAAGLLVIPNIQSLHANPYWDEWTKHTSGGLMEYWMRWGGPGQSLWGDRMWLDHVAIFEQQQAAGKMFLCGTPTDGATDVRSQRYGRASFFVGWKGEAGATFSSSTANQEWRLEIGKPVEERRLYATNVWGKRYDDGIALVNIGSVQQTVSLGGAYRNYDGAQISSITLAPLTGAVLRP
jgi:hypothetical protein